MLSPSPSSTPTPTPTPTLIASQTPVPIGFKAQSDGSIAWVDGGGNERTVPQFNGLKPQLEDGRVAYLDAKGEAAEFKPNLVVSGEQTGVLVIRADIAAALTKAAHDAGNYQFALMIDPRSIPNDALVTLDFDTISIAGSPVPRAVMEIPAGHSAPLVQFNYDKPFAVLNVQNMYVVINYELFPNQDVGSLPPSQIPKGHELDLMEVLGTNDGRITTTGVVETPNSPVGQDFGDASGEISVVCQSVDLTKSITLSGANLLTSDGTPLAIMANT